MKLLAAADAGGGEFLFTFGCELVGDDRAANGGEDIAGVPVAIFVEAGHRILIFYSVGENSFS
jgi:hypothetical protein